MSGDTPRTDEPWERFVEQIEAPLRAQLEQTEKERDARTAEARETIKAYRQLEVARDEARAGRETAQRLVDDLMERGRVVARELREARAEVERLKADKQRIARDALSVDSDFYRLSDEVEQLRTALEEHHSALRVIGSTECIVCGRALTPQEDRAPQVQGQSFDAHERNQRDEAEGRVIAESLERTYGTPQEGDDD